MQTKRYNIFIFLSNFSRGLTSSFSATLLYKSGYSIKEILLFLGINNLISIIVNFVTVKLSQKINNKYILLASTIFYIITFYYLNNLTKSIKTFIIFNIIYALSEFTYHPLRHKYALNICQKDKLNKISNIVILSYLALSPAALIGAYLIENGFVKSTIILLLITSLISLTLINNKSIEIVRHSKEKRNIEKTYIFFILEQFKVIFYILYPLYIYINVDTSIKYIGLVNLFVCISSVVVLLIFKRKNLQKLFPIICIFFSIILFIKINTTSKYLIIILSFIEGICLKCYEIISTKNMYNYFHNDASLFIIKIETIYCLTRFIIYLLLFLLPISLKLILSICCIFIFLSSFSYQK